MSDSEDLPPRDPALATDEQPIIYDLEGLARVSQQIAYPVPEAAERVPWLERLDVLLDKCLPEDFNVEANVARENAFFDLTLEGVRQGLRKFKYLGVKYTRPTDFYAEMIKSDEHMKKIATRLETQTARLEAVEKRKEKIAQRKVGKQIQAEARKEKSRQRKDALKEIEEWKKARREHFRTGKGPAPELSSHSKKKLSVQKIAQASKAAKKKGQGRKRAGPKQGQKSGKRR